MVEEKIIEEKSNDNALKNSLRKSRNERLFEYTMKWSILFFAGLYFCFHVFFVVWHLVTNQAWLLDIVKAHYAALIGLPFAAYASVCLVLFLESRYDNPIEFKAIGFEFKGASGPIILWTMCFLVFTICIKLLW